MTALSKKEKWIFVLSLVLSAACLYSGWRLFWFLTDDAYISFRYVSNSILGHGYVWNPPPFRPIEGYTNFLWVVLLDVVWRISNVTPPNAANYLSLFFSFLTLLVGSLMVLRIRLHQSLRSARLILLGFVLLGTVTNRTFLTWSSSGLETAMFNFFIISWVYCIVFGGPANSRRLFLSGATAACIALTRPEGVLFAAATVVIFFSDILITGKRWNTGYIAGLLPIFAVPVHFIWRRMFYGEWLPNTYYAKYSGMWPESGVRYAASFILEYAVWAWVILLVFVVLRKTRSRAVRQAARDSVEHQMNPSRGSLALLVVVLTLTAHLFYYTIVIGGDHFEYRIYSHLVILLFVSFAALLNAAGFNKRRAVVCFALFIVFSWPIPWIHKNATRRIQDRRQAIGMRVPVARYFPKYLRWYAAAFDDLQYWLIGHLVCVRHQELKIAHRWWTGEIIPSRDTGSALPATGYPVMVAGGGIGGLAWVLPRMNIIDLYGLNDYVIARNTVAVGQDRKMAHDGRQTPEGYLGCFAPNARLVPGRRVEITPRSVPLTADIIRSCETDWWGRAKARSR